MRLSSFSTNNTFGIISTIATGIGSGGRIVYSPDVASSPGGYIGWVAYVKGTSSGTNLHVARVDVSSGAVADIAIDEVIQPRIGPTNQLSPEPTMVVDLVPLVAPRIFVNSDDGNCSYVVAQHRRVAEFGINGPIDLERFTPLPATSMFRVCGTSSLTAVQLTSTDFFPPGYSNFDHDSLLVGEFDVDCAAQSGANTCVISGHRQTTQAQHQFLWSRQFTITFPSSNAPEISFQTNWVAGSWRANGLMGMSAVGSPQNLFLSAGRGVYSSSVSNGNTRNLQYPAFAVSGSTSGATTPVSDRQTCSTLDDGGFIHPAMSMHGGYSVSWCPTCNGGRLVGLNFGYRSDNDDYCY